MAQEMDVITKETLRLVSTVITLAALCTEFALEMTEMGHGEKVRPMIAKLDSVAKTVETGDPDRLREDMISFMAEMETLRMFCRKRVSETLGVKFNAP